MQALIPRLRTERLLLREPRSEDFEGFAAHLADPLANEYTPGVVAERRVSFRHFAASAGYWVLTGAGWWMLELLATGEVVGTVGAFFRETALDPASPRPLELGWSVYRAHWRQGFAGEAAAAALAHALPAHRPARVIAHIDGANLASIAVSRRLGMRYEGEVDFYGGRVGRYALPDAALAP